MALRRTELIEQNDMWDYPKLNEHIKECKKDSEKLSELREIFGENIFRVNINIIFINIEDDGKVFELLKNIYSIAQEHMPRFKNLKRKDIPLLRKKPFFIERDNWISRLYARHIVYIDDTHGNVWARDIFCNEIMFPDHPVPVNSLLTILKEWRLNPPDQRVLSELKQMLNLVDRFRHPDDIGIYMKQKTSIVHSSFHIIQESPEIISVEFIELLIHFGGEFKEMDKWMLYVSRTSLIKAREWMKIHSQFERMYFGRKINKWATECMDDEFNFSPMRARISLRDTFEVLKSKQELKK